jgi:hypothetical protein
MPTGIRSNGSTKRVVRQCRTYVYDDATGESIPVPVVPPAHPEDAVMSADPEAIYENFEHQGAPAVDVEPAPTSPMSPGAVSDGEHPMHGRLHDEVPTLRSRLRDVVDESRLRGLVTQALKRDESPLLWVTADGREGHFMLQHPEGYHLTLRKFGFIGVRFVNLRGTQVLVSWCKQCPCGSTRIEDHLQGLDFPDSAIDALFDEDVTHCIGVQVCT